MVERLLITLALVALGLALMTLLGQRHRRRATAVAGGAARPRLLYFYGDHCAGCHTQARFLDRLAGAIPIERIDVGRKPDVAEQYGIFTLPTTLLVDAQGAVRHINYGVTDNKRLHRQLEKIL